MTITGDVQAAILKVPASAWQPAYDGDGQARDGAWAADVTGPPDPSPWPAGMLVIVRKERPHPGAQPRFTDADGHRFTAFATDATKGQLAGRELRHRHRARCEDQIRCAKDTGLRNLPLKGFARNQLWCEIVALAVAMGQRRDRRRRPPAGSCAGLTSHNRHYDQERRTPGLVESRPPGATAGEPTTSRT